MAKEKKAAFEIRLSETALKNIDEISGYIAFVAHQPLNAAKVADAIFETFDRIAAHPFSFMECDEIPTKNKIYRRAVCLSWLIIYKINGDEIIVLGVIHRSRKPSVIKMLRKR